MFGFPAPICEGDIVSPMLSFLEDNLYFWRRPFVIGNMYLSQIGAAGAAAICAQDMMFFSQTDAAGLTLTLDTMNA